MTEIASWPDPQGPLRIEYSPQAMERIRKRVLEGVKALPESGPGVGGLLLGERAGARVRVLDSVDLPCGHAFGPSFSPTPQERAQGREMVETIDTMPVVGWYFSRAGGNLELTEADVALYRELFPAEWQITLLLRAATDEPVRAAFFCSAESGELVKGVERDLDAWFAGRSAPEPVTPGPLELAAFTPHANEPDAGINDEYDGDEYPHERPRRFGKLSWILTAIIALAVGAAAFEIQNYWLTEAPPQGAPAVQVP